MKWPAGGDIHLLFYFYEKKKKFFPENLFIHMNVQQCSTFGIKMLSFYTLQWKLKRKQGKWKLKQ